MDSFHGAISISSIPGLQGSKPLTPPRILQQIAQAMVSRPTGLMVHNLTNAPDAWRSDLFTLRCTSSRNLTNFQILTNRATFTEML